MFSIWRMLNKEGSRTKYCLGFSLSLQLKVECWEWLERSVACNQFMKDRLQLLHLLTGAVNAFLNAQSAARGWYTSSIAVSATSDTVSACAVSTFQR